MDKRKIEEDLKEILITVLAGILIGLFIITFIACKAKVMGESMSPTLKDGEYVAVSKISYLFAEPKRFDVIIVSTKHTELQKDYIIKRVIGLPGETVRIEKSVIYINGEELADEYGQGYTAFADKEITLGENEYFVLGDNRERSLDSRSAVVGKVQKKDIIGKAFRVKTLNNISLSK